MTVTNIHDAKTHFSKLVERAEAGEEITIARYVEAPKPVRKPGSMKGKIRIHRGFNKIDKEIAARFNGGPG
jgi:antitoxin (DNA-binding transcriptional repressor) of toxin-antitoxin stability system